MPHDDTSSLKSSEAAAQNALAQGLNFLKEKQPDRVIEVLMNSSSVTVRDWHCVRALALFQLNRVDEGVAELGRELEKFPDNKAARELLKKVHESFPGVALKQRQDVASSAARMQEVPRTSSGSELDKIIPAEILNDELYNTIVDICKREPLSHVLEIGSSSGAGSTKAFVTGLLRNPSRPALHCLELSKSRFEELSKSLSQYPFAHCKNASSVPAEEFLSPDDVKQFCGTAPAALNNRSLERVLTQLAQDVDYLHSSGCPADGIDGIKREFGIDIFDLVLIDGSEFTGAAELDRVYGARWIVLNDVLGLRNQANYEALKSDVHYQLWRENLSLRNGYAVFRRAQEIAPIHFFTIVLNGMPFLTHHIEEMRKLRVPWHWHIVEGLAELKHDTAWSVPSGGHIPAGFDKNGLSIDGTTEYLNALAKLHPDHVSVYRNPQGARWQGKIEMVNAPLAAITAAGLLWQLDSDELWTASALEGMHQLFARNPERTAAYVHCDYFVGPSKYVSSMNTWATGANDWARVWRYSPGMKWGAHEPPVLLDSAQKNVAAKTPFTRDETRAAGLSFQHYSYVTPEQVKFKEAYYGYSGALERWQALQNAKGALDPAQYLHWAKHAVVEEWTESKGHRLGARYMTRASAPSDYRSMSTNSGGRFEAELRKLFERIRPAKIIETGTYKGQGTTSIIARALRDFAIPNDFTTIEVNPEHHAEANRYFNSQGIRLNSLCGLSLPRALLPSQEKIRDEFVQHKEFSGIYYDHDEGKRAELYFAETNFNVPDNLLHKVLEQYAFAPDFVLLDSAGHLGFAEFQYLIAHLKAPCFLMLDDVYHCKHYKSLQVIKNDPRFSLLVECPEKFGFCIAQFTPAEEGDKKPRMDIGADPQVRSILFMRTDAIGDAVMASSMLEPLSKRYPGAKITVLCKEYVAELYQSSPYVSAVIPITYNRALAEKQYLDQVVAQVRKLRADLLINSLYSREIVSELITAQCNIPKRVTLRGDSCNIQPELVAKTNDYYTTIVDSTSEGNELLHHKDLLSALGINVPALRPTVWLTQDDERFAAEVFARNGLNPATTICVAPGSFCDEKVYPNFGHALALAAELAGYRFLTLGNDAEKNLCANIAACLGGRAINLSGQLTLRQNAALIKRSKILVASDSALAHIACAVGTQNLVILGGGHFWRFLPYSNLTSVVCLPLACYGCQWKCVYDRVHCVKDIAPETLVKALRETMRTPSSVPRMFVQTGAIAGGPKGLSIMPEHHGVPKDCSIIPV